MKSTKNKNKGFTLVETLVAISILSLSILGTFTAVQNGLLSSSFAKDQITAFYLTQEAVEYIRNMRDENSLKSIKQIGLGNPAIDWMTGVSANVGDPCYPGKVCELDSGAGNLTSCVSAGQCDNLRQDPVSSLFGYSPSWPTTYFNREIKIDNVVNGGVTGREIKITVTVKWNSGPFAKTLKIEQYLYNSR